ncbi:MAG: orotidine-5'-phosphate decarboxylase [Actinomycetia bacterium]|nr:orotidine-5'-phosphate decarboxylase [Actinomycetes bacterium]
MREKIIVALDMPEKEAALDMARSLKGHVPWVKIGMTLFYSEGPDIIREMRGLGFKVFVDLKMHDIPHQVSGACRVLVRAGADMFTVHASGGRAMLEAAVQETKSAASRFRVAPPGVIAVTVLTSLDDAGLAEIGIQRTSAEEVMTLGTLAWETGCDGVVCSPAEATAIRGVFGEQGLVITPGVRPAWAEAGDQARVATPAEAIAAGASHLVIGRPITQAPVPAEAVRRIVEGE